MVKIAISGFVLAGFILGGALAKGGTEEIIFARLEPTTGILLGGIIIFLSWLRFKKKI